MRSEINNVAMLQLTRGTLAALPAAVLIGVLVGHDALGMEADPLSVMVVCVVGMFALVVAAHYPAAFIAPVLFLPRLKEVSALRGFGVAENWTALQLAVALLIAGIVLRLFRSMATGDRSLFGGQATDGSIETVLPQVRFRIAPAQLAFLLFTVLVSVSYLYSDSPNNGITKLTGFLTLGCCLFVAPVLLFISERDFRDFTVGTVLFGMAVAASSLSFSATGAMGTYENPAHIGKGQVIGLALLLLLFAPAKDRRLRSLILFVLVPWLALGLISAETRGPLVSLMLIFLLSVFMPSIRLPGVSARQLVFVLAALVGGVMLLSMYWFYGNTASRFRSKTLEMVSLVQNAGGTRGTGAMRLHYYGAALSLWLERPFLGWGIGGWSMAYWQRDAHDYPHNLVLETLVEQGAAGLAALTYFLIAVIQRWRAHRTEISDTFPATFPCLIYLLLISMFSGDLDDDRFIWFWCGLTLAASTLAMRVGRIQIASNREQQPRGLAVDAIADQSPLVQ